MFVLAVTFGHLGRVVFTIFLFNMPVTGANCFTDYCGIFGGLE